MDIKQKKQIIITIALTLIIFSSNISAATDMRQLEVIYNSVNVILNGNYIDSKSLIHEGTTYLPIRKISEMFGSRVDWDEETRTIKIENTKEEKIITNDEENGDRITEKEIKVIDVAYNSVNIKVNNQFIEGDNIIYEDTTYIPIRRVAEVLNKKIYWDGSNNTVSIEDKEKEEIKVEKGELNKQYILKGDKKHTLVGCRFYNIDFTEYTNQEYVDKYLKKGQPNILIRLDFEMSNYGAEKVPNTSLFYKNSIKSDKDETPVIYPLNEDMKYHNTLQDDLKKDFGTLVFGFYKDVEFIDIEMSTKYLVDKGKIEKKPENVDTRIIRFDIKDISEIDENEN